MTPPEIDVPKELWLVELELKRIQTLLFDVPRLSVMVGANALFGETLRGLWQDDGFSSKTENLPRLARDRGAAWPHGVSIPDAIQNLKDELLECEGIPQDDVRAVAEKTGVLTRDGGHFEAVFLEEDKAKQFIEDARKLIVSKLPGAIMQARLFPLERVSNSFIKRDEVKTLLAPNAAAVFDLPQAEICQYSGGEPASAKEKIGGEGIHLGCRVQQRLGRGRAFDQGKTHDVLGILRPALLKRVGLAPSDVQSRFPSEFAQLSTQGYIAIVHVDGNSVGKRFKESLKGAEKGDFFKHWARKESFFHCLRSGMRQAVLGATKTVFQGKQNRKNYVPLRFLMLGGDDLVLACGAPYALPFVKELAKEIQNTTKELPAEEGARGPLTIAAGVAIVQENFPFHHAHNLAEQLCQSAKRVKHLGSAVDWLVTSEAWYGDIEDTRRQTAVLDGELVLSAKPYPILNASPGAGEPESAWQSRSLEQLLCHAEKLCERESAVARTQLNRLAQSLTEGRHLSRFVAATLSKNTLKPLREYGYLAGKEKNTPWQEVEGKWVTRFLDLFELYELERLKEAEERNSTKATHQEESHA